jgi:hypothetical protein
MAIKTSTGLRNKMLDTGSFKTVMNLGKMVLYGGTVPADADQASNTGTNIICTITNASGVTGLTFAAAAASGVITKTLAEVWSGVNANTGTVTHYRLLAAGDTGALSTTEARVQGLVGTAGADLNLSAVGLTAAATQVIDYYSMALPTA